MSLSWELAQRRQTLAEWRDRQEIAVCAMLNKLAQEAIASFEAHLADANLIDSVWDPSGFAEPRIDAWMRTHVPEAIKSLMDTAASELASLSADFAVFSEALMGGQAIAFPELSKDENSASADEKNTQVTATGKLPSVIARIGNTAFAKNALNISAKITLAMKEAGIATERTLQDRTGLYARLRDAAQNRVAKAWLGGTGDPRPVLAQTIDLIDGVTGEARISIQ